MAIGNWLSSMVDGAMGTLMGSLRTMCFWLISIIYGLLVNVYNLFEKLCSARILDNELLNEFSKRVGLILGIIMFFYVIFSFVQMLIDPEKINNKESGAVNIIKKILIVLVLLGVSNACFNMLFGIQRKVIETDLIPKLFLPVNIDEKSKSTFGNLLSASLIDTFYIMETDQSITDLKNSEPENYSILSNCRIMVDEFKEQVYKENKYNLGYWCLNETVTVTKTIEGEEHTDEVYVVDFNGIVGILAGGYTVYLILMYCFKVGIRMIQIAFLEIISPMAIISYMSPKKDNMFNKWLSLYTATYTDVFIRIAIINFVVFLICTIFSESGNFTFWETVNAENGNEKLFFTIIIVLALLTFAKKAPELLKELLPASKSKLGFGTSMKEIFGLQQGIGMVAGATTGAAVGLMGGILGGNKISNMITGAFGGIATGALRGAKAGIGAKGLGKAISSAQSVQQKANINRANRIHSGATYGNILANKTQEFFGYVSGYQELESEVASLNDLKADLEKEDPVKYAQSAHDTAYNKYVEKQVANNQSALSIEDWEKQDEIGKMYTKQLKDKKDETFQTLFNQNGAFTEKVKMHNKRFGTNYNEKSLWNDSKDKNGNSISGINTIRKSKGTQLEKIRAQKPKK